MHAPQVFAKWSNPLFLRAHSSSTQEHPSSKEWINTPFYLTVVKVVWCAGCNPSSVLRRHSAMRATRAPCRRDSAPICPCTLRVSRLTQARGDLILLGIIACHGRYRFCPLPRVSPYASRRRSPTWWMEFPQTSGPKAAPQLTNH